MLMILIRWVINALSLILVTKVVPGVNVEGFYAAMVAAAILGLVNAVIRPFLILLTLPINILTLGLFTLVINALMLLLVNTIVRGFTIVDFKAALLAAIVLWIISIITNIFDRKSSQPL